MKLRINLSNFKDTTKYGIITMIVFLATVLSQSPVFVASKVTRLISIPIWILFALVSLYIYPRIRINKYVSIEIYIAIIFVFSYFVGMVFIPSYKDSALPYPFFLSVFILIIGIMCGYILKENELKNALTLYAIAGIFVGFNIYISYIMGHSIDGRSYLYDSKNSVSQILLSTWAILLIFKTKENGLIRKIFYYASLVALTYILIVLKSRATLIAIPIIALIVLLSSNLNKKAKRVIAIGIVVSFALLMNDNIYDIFVNQILLAGRQAGNLNDISSGRIEEWLSFGDKMSDTWLFGHGRDKQESMLLTSLLEFGVIGGGLMIIFALKPIFFAFSLNKNNEFKTLFLSLSICYFVNGIFEQLAPFGPGTKCFLLWFLYGYLTSRKYIEQNE